MKPTFLNKMPETSTISFSRAVVVGLSKILKAAVAFLILLQVVYAVGWLVGLLTKSKWESAGVHLPTTGWAIASDANMSVMVAGLVTTVCILMSIVLILGVIGLVAFIGGWRLPREAGPTRHDVSPPSKRES